MFHNNHEGQNHLKRALTDFSGVFLGKPIDLNLFDWVNFLDMPTRHFNIRYIDDLTSLREQVMFDRSYPIGEGDCMRNANMRQGMPWNTKGDCHATFELLESFADSRF